MSSGVAMCGDFEGCVLSGSRRYYLSYCLMSAFVNVRAAGVFAVAEHALGAGGWCAGLFLTAWSVRAFLIKWKQFV